LAGIDNSLMSLLIHPVNLSVDEEADAEEQDEIVLVDSDGVPHTPTDLAALVP